MRYNAADILTLLQEVAGRAGMTLEYASFKEIHSKMEDELGEDLPFSEDYLYKRVFFEVKNAKGKNAEVRLNANYINRLAAYLEYTSYDEFKRQQQEPVHPILEKCLGTWYSYARCNSGQPYVLIAPVLISKEGREVFMHLQGKVRVFQGKMRFEGNCIYCLLESRQGKNMHFVLKVGIAAQAEVLQGVFSGMSTAGDPIAGREVLILQKDKKFNMLRHARVPIEELLKSKDETEKLIGRYFSDSHRNILKGGQTSTFGIDDLNESEL